MYALGVHPVYDIELEQATFCGEPTLNVSDLTKPPAEDCTISAAKLY